MSRASQAANPWVGKTYIPDNPRMDTPPAWFLQRIHDYDAELVLFPSRYRPYAYVIARRCRLGRRGLTGNAIVDTITQPDTKMVMMWGCVPVCYMYKHGPIWNVDTVIRTLKARDLWAVGGGDKAADLLEEQEAEEQRKRDAAIRDDMWNRSGDAWRSYQARTGQRVAYEGPVVKAGRRTGMSIDQGPARPGAAHTPSSSS